MDFTTFYGHFWNQKNSPCSSGQYDNWICRLFHRLRGDSKPIIIFSKAEKKMSLIASYFYQARNQFLKCYLV